MSWWKKHRKEIGIAAALAAAAAATIASGGTATPAVAPALGTALAEGGMMAAGTTAGTAAAGTAAAAIPAMAEMGVGGAEVLAAQQAAAAAAEQAAAMGSTGMFNMVPGIPAGAEQQAMLAAQNEGLGGWAADKTASAAMDAVRASNPDSMTMITEKIKADLAGMNDPRMWGERLVRNAGRYAVTAAKNAAPSLAMSLMGGGQQTPQAMPPQAAAGQPQQQIQMYGKDPEAERKQMALQLIAMMNAPEEEKARLRAQLGVM